MDCKVLGLNWARGERNGNNNMESPMRGLGFRDFGGPRCWTCGAQRASSLRFRVQGFSGFGYHGVELIVASLI